MFAYMPILELSVMTRDKFLNVFGDDIGTRTDIMGNGEANTGRINNLKTNLYGKDNEYSAGNIDSGAGYELQQ